MKLINSIMSIEKIIEDLKTFEITPEMEEECCFPFKTGFIYRQDGEFNYNYGCKWSNEMKKQLSEEHKEKYANKEEYDKRYGTEFRKKMSKALKGRVPWNKGLKYKKSGAGATDITKK